MESFENSVDFDGLGDDMDDRYMTDQDWDAIEEDADLPRYQRDSYPQD